MLTTNIKYVRVVKQIYTIIHVIFTLISFNYLNMQHARQHCYGEHISERMTYFLMLYFNDSLVVVIETKLTERGRERQRDHAKSMTCVYMNNKEAFDGKWLEVQGSVVSCESSAPLRTRQSSPNFK